MNFLNNATEQPSLLARYDVIVRALIPENTGIRDQRAVTSIAAGLLKILYPDLNVTSDSFRNYCLAPAIELRQIIRNQLWQLDAEYRRTDRHLSASLMAE